MNRNSEDKLILQNINQHQNVANHYQGKHIEIYNAPEQERLAGVLKRAVSLIESDTKLALDYGCGAGNLTTHLVDLGYITIAADVTPKFVEMVCKMYPHQTKPLLLNGKNLENVESNSVDIVATYSVLHHVPDYLTAIADMYRVITPGGVLLLEHEASPMHWSPNTALQELRTLTKQKISAGKFFELIFSPKWWLKKIRKTINPRFAEEGDIHVWFDDHIEWDKIQQLIEELGGNLVSTEDYLLYQPHYPIELYSNYKDQCNDMRYMIFKKPR